MENIKEMVYGDNTTVMYVVDVKESKTRTGSTYLRVTLRDKMKREITCNQWGASLGSTVLQKGKLYEVTVNKGTYNGSDSFTLVAVGNESEAGLEEYINDASHMVEEINREIIEAINGITDTELKEFMVYAYGEMVNHGFLSSSAAKSVHHNYKSGLAYHTYGMVKLALAIAQADKRVNKDILVAGCILHDIGKLVELKTEEDGSASYTKEGLLYGHLVIGESLVKKMAEGRISNINTVNHLCHIILSHHGKMEWGSPVEPMTVEAFLVHQIDYTDSRKEIFFKTYETLDDGEIAEKRLHDSTLRICKM